MLLAELQLHRLVAQLTHIRRFFCVDSRFLGLYKIAELISIGYARKLCFQRIEYKRDPNT